MGNCGLTIEGSILKSENEENNTPVILTENYKQKGKRLFKEVRK
jgi:hypothetical protein